MGTDKALKKFVDKPMVLFPLKILERYCSEIIISANDERLNYIGYRIINDDLQDIGPIGGLYSCLKHSQNNYSLVLACDMPMISGLLIGEMIINLGIVDAVVPLLQGNPEPLYAIYHKRILPKIEQGLHVKTYSLQQLLKGLNVHYIDVDRKYENEFCNANTPDELIKLEQVAKTQFQ